MRHPIHAVLASILTVAPCTIAAAQTDPTAQRAEVDWSKVVLKAHRSPRIMLRRAAAGKVARGGDAAADAVRAYQKEHGRNAISLELVSAYVRTTEGGPGTLALLEDWARDKEFYWRAHALGALATRHRPQHRELFRISSTDPAWLTRVEAARGLCRLGTDREVVVAMLLDPDPRVRTRIAASLSEIGDDRALPTLVEALRCEARYFDYAWGQLGAQTAFTALAKRAGKRFGYTPGKSAADNAAAIAEFEGFARERLGPKWVEPVKAPADNTRYQGGIEIRSCRHGDLFVRWTADRTLVFGLAPGKPLELSAAAWKRLWANPPGEGVKVHGQAIVCDYLRVLRSEPRTDRKVGPGALPEPSRVFVEALAAVVADTGRDDLASQILTRLEQFRSPRGPR
ncbi:MAG: HEAT repeat domain-containing protein [Planctomycetes bacterium]|nr:HEAT repeat domain-containing protein [Planctomycetota bacterium]MCB9868944.1 HEAT repeat domain-containing protein [Planctomycetota bacterium]